MPPQRWGGYSLPIAALTASVSKRCRTEHHTRGKQMDDFLSEVQSDELAECEEFQEWIDLRMREATEAFDAEQEDEGPEQNFIEERWHWND